MHVAAGLVGEGEVDFLERATLGAGQHQGQLLGHEGLAGVVGLAQQGGYPGAGQLGQGYHQRLAQQLAPRKYLLVGRVHQLIYQVGAFENYDGGRRIHEQRVQHLLLPLNFLMGLYLLGHVSHQAVVSGHPAGLHVGHKAGADVPREVFPERQPALEIYPLAGQRPLNVLLDVQVGGLAHHLAHGPAQQVGRLLVEPPFVGVVGELIPLLLVYVADEHRQGIGNELILPGTGFAGLAGQHLFGHFEAKHQYSINAAMLVVAGLKDEVEVPVFQHIIAGPAERHQLGRIGVGNPRSVHPAQRLVRGQGGCFRHSRQHSAAQQLAARQPLLEDGIHQLVHQIGAGQNADGGGRGHKQALEAGALLLGVGAGGQRGLGALGHAGIERFVELLQVRLGVLQLGVIDAQLGVGGTQGGVGVGQLLIQVLHLLAGLHLLAHVGSHYGDARNAAVDFAQGLVHEVPVHGVAAALAVDERGQLAGHEGHARGQHFVQQLLEALVSGLGQQLEHGRAQGLQRGAVPHGARRRISRFNHISRPPQHGHGHRGLLEQLVHLPLLGLLLLPRPHLLAHVVGKGGNAGDGALFVVGLVGEGEIHFPGRAAGSGRQGERQLVPEVGGAGAVHLVEQGHEAAAHGFGQGLGHGAAQELAVGK